MRPASAFGQVRLGWAPGFAVIAALAALSFGTAALAAPSPTVDCPALAAKGASTVLALDALDPRIGAELDRRFSVPGAPGTGRVIAPRDSDWQVTDVVSPGTPLLGRRFIAGGRIGERWYVWYESGGIAHLYHVAIFDLLPTSPAPHLVLHAAGSLDALCPVTAAQLVGRGAEAAPPDRGFW